MSSAILIAALSALAFAQRPVEQFDTKAGAVKITIIRHASLMIEAGGQVIHIDPWSQANYDGLPKADLILITDIHGDHLDPKAIATLKKDGTKIMGPAAVSQTVPETIIIGNGESQRWGAWTIEAIPMYNITRGPAPGRVFHEKGRGNGYVLTYGGKRFYLSGDTEGIPEMRALKNIDVAFVCMNLPYTMTPEEAADAARSFAPKIVYPYHYRQSETSLFAEKLKGAPIEVRLRDWYYQ
jgi:L-ascorbate metabolism protein UlaG (beta-lactamase superfamily)